VKYRAEQDCTGQAGRALASPFTGPRVVPRVELLHRVKERDSEQLILSHA